MEYVLKKGPISLKAAEKGAELCSLTWQGRELLWQADPEVWPRHAPVCFPWCGKLSGGWGTYGGKRCEGPQHGFARDLPHTLTDQGEDFLCFRLNWPGSENWPWPFTLDTEHRLLKDGAVTTCTVTNTGAEPMALQLGFHPGFRCPFVEGTAAADYQVRFANGRVVPLTEHLFDNDSIPYENVGPWARLEHRDSGEFIQVGTEGFFRVLLWSKPGIPGFLCIEPWQGFPGPQRELEHRPGAVVLSPGEEKSWKQEIKLEMKKAAL